jgi:hypothetical protein
VNYRAAFTNRKKVRGWKTQVRRVERWRSDHLTPDWPHFERYDYDYCKIQIHPWNRLVEREPPIWLGRRMGHGLLDIHDAWAETSGPEVKYLKVWLKWPLLRTSQVVMAGESRLAWYEGVFRPVTDLGWAETKGFPPQLGPDLLERLRDWDWQECLDEYEVDRANLPAGWLSKRPHSSLTYEDGRSFTLVEVGRVWVGQKVLPGGH